MNWKLGASALTLAVRLTAADYDNTWQKTFQLAGAGERRLVIENIVGNLRVTGGSGPDIRMTVHENWHAPSDADLARGREEMKLRTEQTGNVVNIFVETPNRRGRENWHHGTRSDDELRFRFDFDVEVPRDIHLDLKTVTGGEVSAAGTQGEWHLKNVNGGVVMKDAGGFGSAETVNGSVKVAFAKNPVKPCAFRTVNGAVETAFQPDLSADLRLKTMTGDAYTDFEIAPVTTPVTAEASGNLKRYRIGNTRVIRIGAGGVQHDFHTLNGSIRIRKIGK